MKLFFAKLNNQILSEPGVTGADHIIPYTDSSALKVPVDTVVPINLQFLTGADAGTASRLAVSASIVVAIKATAKHTDSQRLAVCSTLTRPDADSGFYTGEIDLRGDELIALLDGVTGNPRGITVPAILTVSYKLSGETDAQYKTCLPCPVVLYSTGFNVGDTAPTIP